MKRILHVSGRPERAEWVAAALKGQGFRVTTAESGQQGIEYLSKTTFDIILLGLQAPVKPADRVIEWVVANRPPLTSRILVVSENELPLGLDALLESLEIPQLCVPFTTGKLVQFVAAMVSLRQGALAS